MEAQAHSVNKNVFRRVGSFAQIDLNATFVTSIEDEIRLSRLCNLPKQVWSPEDIAFIETKVAQYSENQYSEARYSRGFYSIDPARISGIDRDALPNTVRDIDTTWDSNKFLIPRAPFKVGTVADRDVYSTPATIRCLHLPIKMPGSSIRIPKEYLQFREALTTILSFERSVNPSFNEYYAYLTVDQRFVPRDASQRLPGAHVDGIPRDRDNPQFQKIDHSYLVTDSLGTRFFTHPFPLADYDLRRENFFAAMRLLADESQSLVTKPYDINLMNAYSVHTAIPSDRHCYRTFMRLEFSTLQFDRAGNAINPYFDYSWEYRPSVFPEELVIPDDLLKEEK